MQIKKEEFNPDAHEKFFALTVKQPYAGALVKAAYKDENGVTYGAKSIEVRSRKTNYRGDVLICASKRPIVYGLETGCTLGMCELYDVKPIADFTEEDWEKTRIPKEKRSKIKAGYGWLMRNPRRVIEYPVRGQLGIFNIYYTKGDIMPYPEAVALDEKGYKQLMKEANNGRH